MTQIIRFKPLVKMFDFPLWYHHHGSKLLVKVSNEGDLLKSKTLILKSNAVEVKIHPDSAGKGWVVEYEIRHSPESWSKGQVWMSVDNLEAAFGLSGDCEEMWGQNILIDYGGDVAYQGKYIRYGKCLNIPGPGTGHDGDANLSIYVDEEIKSAVEQLLR